MSCSRTACVQRALYVSHLFCFMNFHTPSQVDISGDGTTVDEVLNISPEDTQVSACAS